MTMEQGRLENSIVVGVLGGFSIKVDGKAVHGLAVGSQRLLVFLALHDRTVSRTAVASALWPELPADRAGVTLRSALSRLDPETRAAVFAESTGLALADHVRVDLREAQTFAHRLVDTTVDIPLDGHRASAAIATFVCEVLPDWYDEWIVKIGDEWRHQRSGALEAIAIRLLDRLQLDEAASAARAAIAVDPLRETPHATLMRIHLASGNQSNALAVYEAYRTTLRLELDIGPTGRMTSIVDTVRAVGNESARR